MAQEAMPEFELLRETEAPLFVINLCASTTPVALAHPDNPELKRFTFFVTRRREEGRERFRLHMGYFDKLDEAEKLLAIVRDVYPAAWAGPAPGNKGMGQRRTPVATPVRAPAVAAVAVAVSQPELSLLDTQPVVVAKAMPRAAAPIQVMPELALVAEPAPVAAPSASEPVKPAPGLDAMSNVREVLAELGDEPGKVEQARVAVAAQPSMKPAPKQGAKPLAQAAARAEPALHIPELKTESTGRHGVLPKPSLSDSQVLRVLEARRDPPVVSPAVPSDANAETSIRMITPEDTQTLRDIKLDVQSNASVSFAVQLQWSVQPIDMHALPTLAIFDAYTLYTVEGNRQGRRWYGLRLGFFSDAMSAKQVAYYVRSDFSAVAVVPVTAKERDRASGKGEPSSRAALDTGTTGTFVSPAHMSTLAAAGAPEPSKPESKKEEQGIAGFELLDNDLPEKKDTPDSRSVAKGKAGKPAGKRPAVRGRAARGQNVGAPQTLEQTLEVLGASTLTIDESRTIINDSGIRHMDVSVVKKKTSRFSRLLDRLSEKM